jgi:Arc/MetJ-type ribon-helix-helix transcriptional regulator
MVFPIRREMGFAHPKLHPHQQDAVRELKSGNILWGGVGSGKTRTAMAYYALAQAPKDIYVITTAKKRDSLDWVREAADFGIGRSKEETVSGVLTVDSWNNIGKYVDVEGAFFIFDEQRLVGRGAWTKSFYKISSRNEWILLSATPGDSWMDYVPVFIANGYYRNRSEFVRDHVVYSHFTRFPKIERYVNTNRLQKLRREVLVHMPYKSEALAHHIELLVEYDRAGYDEILKRRWNIFENKPIANVSELFYLLRKCVYSDRSRALSVRDVLDKHPKVVIFYTFNYELEILRGILEEHGYPYAEWNGHKHEDIPSTDEWAYLVQYSSGSEGWNCTETNAMLFYSLTYSYKMFKQAHGRIDRMDTPWKELYYYTLISKAGIDRGVFSSLTSKKSFNESAMRRSYRLDEGWSDGKKL